MGQDGNYNVQAYVNCGGLSGQAEAILWFKIMYPKTLVLVPVKLLNMRINKFLSLL